LFYELLTPTTTTTNINRHFPGQPG